MSGVPTLFVALLKHPKVLAGKVDFRSIKVGFSGASALLVGTKNRSEALTGGRIVEGYALSESMVAAVVTPTFGAYKPGSVGLPLPDILVRIVDVDDGHSPLQPGEVGEILMHAPQLMQGYWQRPSGTVKTLRPDPASGARWLHTGDLGYMDEDGYLSVGRIWLPTRCPGVSSSAMTCRKPPSERYSAANWSDSTSWNRAHHLRDSP
jgi:long-chain acyl-CoA synthetase